MKFKDFFDALIVVDKAVHSVSQKLTWAVCAVSLVIWIDSIITKKKDS